MKKRNHYSPEQKAKVVLEVFQEEATVWKQEFFERDPEVFKKGASDAEKELEKEQQCAADMERKVGQLTYEVDW